MAEEFGCDVEEVGILLEQLEAAGRRVLGGAAEAADVDRDRLEVEVLVAAGGVPQVAEAEVADLDTEARVDETVGRLEAAVVEVLAGVQVAHARDDVVDERVAEEPVEVDGGVGQQVLQRELYYPHNLIIVLPS